MNRDSIQSEPGRASRIESSGGTNTGGALIDAALLDLLLCATEPVALDELAQRRGLRREALMRELDRLRQAGCEFDSHPQHGLRLLHSGLGAWVDYVQWACPWRGGTRRVEVYRQTASTQDAVRRLAAAHGAGADGAAAIADEQTAGRGRLGRRWLSPPGACALFSRAVMATPDAGPMSVDRLVLATAVATARAIEKLAPQGELRARIKWPNDVMVNDRKIAGILVEMTGAPSGAKAGGDHASARFAVIGIGINVHLMREQLTGAADNLADKVTSFAMLGYTVDRLRVITETLREMDAALLQRDTARLVDEWRQRNLLGGASVRFQHDGRIIQGRVIDIDPYDGLIVRGDDGELAHLPAETTSVQ